MPPRRSQQRRRDEARAQRTREDNLSYQPGPRHTYEESTYSFPMEDTPLTITVRSWNLDWIIQDFEADATWISTDGTHSVLIASLDCRNHGSIHMHDEINDPTHEHRTDIIVLRTAEDIMTYHERALDEFLIFARHRYEAWRRTGERR